MAGQDLGKRPGRQSLAGFGSFLALLVMLQLLPVLAAFKFSPPHPSF